MALAILAAGCAPVTQGPVITDKQAKKEAALQYELAYQEHQTQLQSIMATYRRILKANVDACTAEHIQGDLGARVNILDNISSSYQAAAKKLDDLTDVPTVVAVYADGPGLAAGLKKGDAILEINNNRIGTGTDAMDKLDHLKANDEITLQIQRGLETKDITLTTEALCDYKLIYLHEDIVNAFATGKEVVITSGMKRFLKSDDELAMTVGHELAHNTMGHIDKQKTNVAIGTIAGAMVQILTGVNMAEWGSNVGREAYSQSFEAEADYVGVYYASKAGFDPRAAKDMWRRMAADHPAGIHLEGSSHPSTAKRVLAIEATIDEVEQKKANNEPLTPNLIPEDSQPVVAKTKWNDN